MQGYRKDLVKMQRLPAVSENLLGAPALSREILLETSVMGLKMHNKRCIYLSTYFILLTSDPEIYHRFHIPSIIKFVSIPINYKGD